MRVGLLLVTHRNVGSELLSTASRTLGFCPLQTRVLDVYEDDEFDLLVCRAGHLFAEIDSDNGVLILTDAYGSTPSNVAIETARDRRSMVVTGINLPMLLRVFNYPGQTLEALATSAASGGRKGILEIGQEELTR